MKLFTKNDNYTIYNGSMLDMLTVIEPNSIDSIVCDPPYELGFMGKSWDKTGIAFQPDTWRKCYDALKDGGYLLAFGGSRTFHRMAVAIEDAGFEIRDTIMWLYGSGFPKSMDISKALDKHLGAEREVVGKKEVLDFDNFNGSMMSIHNRKIEDTIKKEVDITIPSSDLAIQWQGWGTALKPAYEPIIVARKPFKTSLVENVMINGVGGINIDECRVGDEHFEIKDGSYDNNENQACFGNIKRTPKSYDGRFPANIIHDGSEEVVKLFPETKPSSSGGISSGRNFGQNYENDNKKQLLRTGHDDNGGSASRFFYAAKASKKDRDEGLEVAGFEEKQTTDGCIRSNIESARKFGANSALRKNIHPTVKPCELMQYLVRLVSPKNATILDPFMGSGSTGKAVMFENRERNANYKFIGIDLTEEYCKIASARIDYALNKFEYDFKQELKEAEKTGQLSLF